MLGWLKRKADRRAIGHELFGRIVAQARQPAFYRGLRIDDTMEGRFELIVVHLVLVLRRLKPEGAAGQRLGQTLMEAMVATMDDALRQIGIGDMGVPRRVQKAAAAFVERSRDYEAGIAANPPDSRLADAICRHVYAGAEDAETRDLARVLADYLRDAEAALRVLPSEVLFAGNLEFPLPPGAHGAGA